MSKFQPPWEVVKILEMQPIEVLAEDVPDLCYRLEILKPMGRSRPFRVRGYRWDMYELKPFGFPGVDISHDQVLVQDHPCRGRLDSVEADSLEEAVAQIIEIFESELS
jgi:hypothetical protein